MEELSIQEIFNKAIELGYYGDIAFSVNCSQFMCLSIKNMYCNGHISLQDAEKVLIEIDKYLKEFPNIESIYTTLKLRLEVNGLPSSFNDRLAIYQDWDNRPKPWEELK